MNVRIRPGGIALFILALAALTYRLLYTLLWEHENDKGPLLSLFNKKTAVVTPTATAKAPAATAAKAATATKVPASATPAAPVVAPVLVPRTAKPLKDWVVLGPISGPSGVAADDLKRMTTLLDMMHLPDQSRLRPQAGETVSVQGADLKWVPIKNARLDLIGASKQSAGRPEAESFTDVVGYAVTTVEVPGPVKGATLYLGSDDGVTVWLNGIKIHRIVTKRGIKPGEDKVTGLSLVTGPNTLVFKVAQAGGTWELEAALDIP